MIRTRAFPEEETMAYELPVTVLGRTGLTVTRLGIGGAYCETPDGLESTATGDP